MQQEITVRVKEVYGNRTVYPVCEIARRLANLIGTKTLTHSALQKIEALGYIIRVEQVTL